jgi:anti-sigma B factor antagonist
MKNPAPTLLVSVADSTVYVKICGRAVFTSSVQFKTLVQELSDRGYQSFVIDLGECLVMDSTFLGVVAGAGSRLSVASTGQQDHAGIELLNPNPRVTELLENLGVMHLFRVTHCAPPDSSEFRAAPPGGACPSREEISRTCLEAHETLMRLNPANVPKLKDITEFLAQDLKKLETRGQPAQATAPPSSTPPSR